MSRSHSLQAPCSAGTQVGLWLRGIAPLLWLPVWTLALSPIVIVLGALKQWDLQTWWMSLWCRGVLKMVGVSVVTEGFDRIPQNGGAILVFNHQSHFDIPALTGATNRRIRYGAKAELYSIPIFGWVLKASGNLPIYRKSRAQVMALYRASIGRLKQAGFSFALAPEGTRQSRPEIGTFKRGPFVFAVEANAPIVPIVIEGAYEVLPKNRWLPNVDRWHRVIQVSVLEPIGPFSSEPESADDAVERLRFEAETQMRLKFESLKKYRS